MNIKFIALGIGIIVVVSFATFYYAIGSEWPTDWNDNANVSGSWGEEVVITYADGSTDSLKLLMDRPSLEVQYMGMAISYIDYSISGYATGSEFTTCNVDVTMFAVHSRVTFEPYEIPVFMDDYQFHENWYIPVGGSTETLMTTRVNIDSILSGLDSGEYSVLFSPSGYIRYRGEGPYDSDWFDATIPSGISLIVDNVAGTINLNLVETWTWN